MSTYTPTTEQVRHVWLIGLDAWGKRPAVSEDEYDAMSEHPNADQFDRWLNATRADWLRGSLATVRSNPDDAHFECDCVPDLGPSHCHACSKIAGTETPWSETYHGPLGERQVEAGARAAYEANQAMPTAGFGEDVVSVHEYWQRTARAVLTVQAEAVGK